MVLILLAKKISTFELSKVTQEKIQLIHLCRTMCLILKDFFVYIYHVGSHFNVDSIIDSGLIAGGRNSSRAVNPLEVHLHKQKSST